ncbi:MAG: metallophosphoesterase [Planctomycetota bacterium]|jgi:putative phosphoesterase
MLVGLCSDSHDNVPQIKAACERLRNARVELVLHAGDVISPFSAKLFAELPCDVVAVYGNNDGEKNILPQILDIVPDSRRHEAGGKSFFLIHDAAQIEEAELGGMDMLIFGHSHEPAASRDGSLLKVNPGEICGYLTGNHSLAIYNTESGELGFENW